MNEKTLTFTLRKMEEKLMELMGNDYYDFAKQLAKDAFRYEIENMEDPDFKQFCHDNFDTITED